MTFSNCFLTFLWKLQYFSRVGSIVWSVIPFPLLPVFIYFGEVQTEKTGKAMQILSYLIMVVWVGFLVMMPQCIRRFREYTSMATCKTTLVTPQCEAPQMIRLLAPSKKMWLVAIVWLVAIIIAFTITISSFSFQATMLIMLMVYLLTAVYSIKFGILFGSLSKTLSKECRTINIGGKPESLDSAANLLSKYKTFKNASKLGLFTVASACTVLTISQSYFTIMTVSCTNYGLGPAMYISVGLTVTGFALYFYLFATSADECFESFKGMAGQLR